MDDIDELENNKRDLGGDEDLELMMDHDQEHEERELKNKIIFSMQGLGGVRTIKRQDRVLEAYIKGPHCEESVKDLVKFIRQDVPSNPKARLIMSEYNVVESDLLELLILQVEDKKLSFWLIALLALLTAKPSDDLLPEEKEKLHNSLREYKNSFVKHECFQILMVHIADFYKTPEEGRMRAHMQMLEFIILLIRNLVQISNSEKYPDLNNHFLAAFIKEDMFNPLLYILQTDRSPLMSKIDIPLLEIFYHTFTCFEPELLYSSKQESFQKLTSAYRSSKKPAPTRHSRFLPMFKITTQSGVQKVVHKFDNEAQRAHAKQRKMPVRMTEYKKVTRLQSDKLTENFMHMEIDGEKNRTIGEAILELSKQFLEVEFEQLIKLVFDNIFREVGKVSENNIIQYLLLCSWALQVVRAKYHKERSMATSEVDKSRVEFNLSWIVEVMQNAHFELIYKILMREATREKKKLFKINMFNAGLKIFNSYLDVITDISNSFNMSERKNANVLMANMFRHDIARILRVGFNQISHEGILSVLIRCTHKFFKLLSVYSDGKVLTIQTSKLLKRKKNKKYESDEDERELVNLNMSDSDNDQEQKRGRQMDEERFQERKYNEKTEFAIIAEYSVITKYMNFLRNERFLTNDEELNESIFYYIQQIKKLLNGEWLFFQAETLCIFQKILASSDWIRKNREKAKLVQTICASFIKLLRKNPLAITESLFRFSSLSLKQQIFKNYSEDYQDAGVQQQNMFTDE